MSDDAPQSTRNRFFGVFTSTQVWKRPPLPNASPLPRNLIFTLSTRDYCRGLIRSWGAAILCDAPRNRKLFPCYYNFRTPATQSVLAHKRLSPYFAFRVPRRFESSTGRSLGNGSSNALPPKIVSGPDNGNCSCSTC